MEVLNMKCKVTNALPSHHDHGELDGQELGFGSVVMCGVDGGICSGPCKMKWYVLFDDLNPQVPLTKKKLQCLNGHSELDGLKTEERSLDMLQPASEGIHIQALKLRYMTFGLLFNQFTLEAWTVTKPGGLRIGMSNVLLSILFLWVLMIS